MSAAPESTRPRPARPRRAPTIRRAGLRTIGDQPVRGAPTPRHQIGRRIDQDGDEVRIVVGLAMQQQDAGLRGDRDADLVGDLQAAAAFEALLGKEHLDVPEELVLILGWQARRVGDVLLDDRAPRVRKRAAANPIAAPPGHPPEHGSPSRLAPGSKIVETDRSRLSDPSTDASRDAPLDAPESSRTVVSRR